MTEKHQLTRKKLYDLVWKKPITHLAKEFDMPIIFQILLTVLMILENSRALKSIRHFII